MVRSRGALVALALAGLLAACSSSGSEGTATTVASKAGTTETVAAGIDGAEAFTGTVEEFYEVPDDVGPGEPGEIIRTMPVEAPEGQAGLRIMYRSTDAEDEARVATGLVFYPDGNADDVPEDGWPVLAWDHGTSGLAAPCAPSRGGARPPDYGVEGVLVAPDYIGLGPVGELHPYLDAAAEGHATIDAVAAARSIPAAHAGDEWVVAGVSQGGHAALVTNEQAADRLPDAELLGAVAMAPGAELGQDFGDQIQIKIITTMVLLGLAAEDDAVDPADYLSPAGLAASKAISEGCMGDIIETMPGPAAADDYFLQDPRESDVGKAWVEANDPGQVAGAPLLLVQGGADILVVPARTDALFERLCSIGQLTERLDIPTADHDTIVERSEEVVSAWIQARFAHDTPQTEC